MFFFTYTSIFSAFLAPHFGEASFWGSLILGKPIDFILGMKLISSYFFLETCFPDSGVVIERFSNDYRKTKTKTKAITKPVTSVS